MRVLFSLSLALLLSLSSASALWKPRDIALETLPVLSYRVTQLGATEPAFDNAYWDKYEIGIYVDITDGTPLFSSAHKYDSQTGWPTFSRPMHSGAIVFAEDRKTGELRTEVKSSRSDAHLGHLFNDGPAEYDGARYCINSASLRFVPLSRMRREGYVRFIPALKKAHTLKNLQK